MASTTVSLFPSPAKKEIKQTDFKKCIICQKDDEEKLQQIHENTLITIIETIELRKDFVSERLQQDLQDHSEFLSRVPQWHHSCRSSWTSKTNASSLRKRKLSPSPSATKQRVTRTLIPDFKFKEMCFLCAKSKLPGKRKHEKLVCVEMDSVQQYIYQCVKDSDDVTVLRRIQGNGDCSIDMVAAEARYHKTCYNNLRHKVRPKVESDTYSQYTKAFEALCHEVEGPLHAGKLMYMTVLRESYIKHLMLAGIPKTDAEKYRTWSLKQRLQKKYGSEILFWPQGGKKSELICSASLSAGTLIQSCIDLKKDMEENYVPVPDDDDSDTIDSDGKDLHNHSENTERTNKIMYEASVRLSSDLKQMKTDDKEEDSASWSVDYKQAESLIPNSLYNLLAFILNEDTDVSDIDLETGRVKLQESLNSRTGTRLTLNERILNLAQNIVFAKTAIRTPQHVSLAVYVYHKTRSKDLITVLNKLGLCISYTDLQRILSSVALEVSERSEDGVFIPSNIIPQKFTQYAIDNLDFSECTLDGTSKHVTSMVMYQYNDVEELLQSGSIATVPKNISRKNSLDSSGDFETVRNVREIRKLRRDVSLSGPQDIEWLLQQETNLNAEMNLCWALARLCPTKLLEVEIECPGWKVFNASISRSSNIATAIGYCPFLQDPPTNPDVVKEALKLCMKSSEKLGLKHTVVTQDQAIYEISYTLRKEKPEDFPDLILRLGGFHLLMNYLGSVGKFMSGSGLSDILVQSKVMLEGTVNNVLSGKGYYQAINAHMRMHEAMISLWWYAFEDFCLKKECDLSVFTSLCQRLACLGDESETDKVELESNMEEICNLIATLKPLTDEFNQSRTEFQTSVFWWKYVDLIQTVLLYIHAEREGKWSEHLAAVTAMLNIITAADHQKYVKAVVTYLAEMKSLPQNAPEVAEEFQKGNFSVKRAGGKFNGIWTDMALECSQNCDAKGKTGQAGLKGVTMKINTQEKWFLTLPFAAGITSALKAMLHTDEIDIQHHEDNRATVTRETEQRKAIIERINVDMINPFTYTESKSLVNIATGLRASEGNANDLLNLNQIGEEAVKKYVESGKLNKLNLKTFSSSDKGQKADKAKCVKSELTDEIQILKRALMIRNRHEDGKDQLEELLSHELRKYPPALAEIDAESKDTVLRTGNKSALLEVFKQKVGLEEWDNEIDSTENTSSVVVDVMWYIRSKPPLHNEESENYGRRILDSIVKKYPSHDIHLVADRYDGLYGVSDSAGEYVSLKQASGCRQRRKESQRVFEVRKGLILKAFDELLCNGKSKANLLAFLFEVWSESSDILHSGTRLYLSGGFHDRMEVKVVGSDGSFEIKDEEKEMLTSTHEEADTRVFLHTAVAIRNGSDSVIICASDTDIVVVAVFHFKHLRENGLQNLYIQSKDYFIPIHELVRAFSEDERNMLPLLHAISGCDTNGFVFGKGKRAFVKAVAELEIESDLATCCRAIEENMDQEELDKIKALATKVFIQLYAKCGEFHSLNAVRAHVYYGGQKYLEALPPTDDALHHHVLRAVFQAYVWLSALNPKPEVLDPFKFGWTSDSGPTKPVLLAKTSTPANLVTDNFCKCKKRCIRNCPCKRLELRCDIACSCRGQASNCARVRFEVEDMEM